MKKTIILFFILVFAIKANSQNLDATITINGDTYNLKSNTAYGYNSLSGYIFTFKNVGEKPLDYISFLVPSKSIGKYYFNAGYYVEFRVGFTKNNKTYKFNTSMYASSGYIQITDFKNGGPTGEFNIKINDNNFKMSAYGTF